MKKINLALLFILSLIVFTSCSDEEGNATFRVRLTDNPADYDNIFIDIQEIRVHSSGSANDNDGGWQSLSVIEPGVYDLLSLTGGIDTVLANAELPAGRISQVRLVLGSDNSIVVDGTEYDLKTPSAMQSGLKLKVNAVLEADLAYDLLLDFDAAKSIVVRGNGDYNLKPVIRTLPYTTGGSVCGFVDPQEADPVIYAIQGQDSISTYTDENGKFCFKGLDDGSYQISLLPKAGYLEKVIESVNVENGVVNDLGVITIIQD